MGLSRILQREILLLPTILLHRIVGPGFHDTIDKKQTFLGGYHGVNLHIYSVVRISAKIIIINQYYLSLKKRK